MAANEAGTAGDQYVEAVQCSRWGARRQTRV
jgi:hypothetical protein